MLVVQDKGLFNWVVATAKCHPHTQPFKVYLT